MNNNAKFLDFLAIAAIVVPAVAFAGHDWVGETLDATENLYLTGTAANWTPESVPESDYVRFMKGNTTATFNNMITPTDYFWVGSTSGTFTDTDGNPLWCVWQSLNDSADYGINANCKLAVSDAADQQGNLWIKSGTYTFSNLDWGKGLGPAKIKLTGGTLKSNGFTNFSGKPEATLEIDGGTFDTDAEFVIGTTEGSTGIVYQTGGTFTPKKFWVGSRYEYGQKAFGRYVMTGGSIATDSGEDFVVGGQDYSTGVVEVVSGTINVGGNLLVPWGGNSTGRMTVGDGSVIECGNFRLCDNNGGDGEYTQNGGKMTVRSAATIANTASRAVATIKGGELSASGNINVATAAGGDGTLVLTGGTLSSGGWVCIGAGGNGYYVQKGGTFNITQAFISGQGSNKSAASYSIISNGTLNANQLFIAENSTSSDMTIEGGTVAISSTAYISKNSSEGRGTLTMNGGRLTIGAETYIANADNSTALVTLNGGDLETTAAKKFYVGKGAGSKGEIVMGGGHLKVNNEIHLAPSSGSTGIVHVTSGTITNTSWLVLGINDAYHESMLRIDGGEVYNQGNVTLGSSMGNGSKDNLVVAGTGVLRTTGNIYIAEGHTRDASNPAEATVTVEGGLVDNSAGETQFFYGNSIAGTTGTLNLNGGEYITKQIQYVNGAGTAKVNFGGGKLKAASGSDSYIIWANGSANMSASLVEDTTSTIDTSSQNLTINVPIDGAGNLVVTGGGSLALGAGMTYTGTTAVEAGTTLSLSDASATTSRLILRGGSVSAPANFSVAEVELASGVEGTLPSWYTTSMKLIISGETTLVVPQGTTLGDVEFRDNGKIVYTLSTYTTGETASVATIGTVAYPENETIAEHVYISVDGVRMATVSDTNGALTAAPREVEWVGNGTVDYSEGTQWQGGALTGFDIAVFCKNATVSTTHPVMKLAGGATVTVAQALTIDALAIGTGGGSINTGGYGVTIANVKSAEGSLGFSGTGTVTISAAPAAPVGLALSGTVTATVPYTTKFSSLSFEAGNLLYVDVSGLSEETTLETPCPISLPQGYVDPNWFVAPKGKRVAFVYNYDDGIKLSSMRVPAEGESVVNVYLGGGNWRTTGNWSLDALPSSTDIALITLSNQTIEDNVADKISVSNIVVKTAYVKFKGGNAWPKIRAQEINGIAGSRIALSCYGLGPVSGKNLEVKVDVEASNLENRNQDCWIEGNDSGSRIAFYGNLYANVSAFRVNGNVDFYGQVVCNYTSDNDNYFSNDVKFKSGSSLTVGANGTVTINTAIEFPGEVTVNGTLHEKAGCTFDSALKGLGTLNLSSGDSVVTHFKGDNSGFSGTINAAKKHVPYLYKIASGSENAVWNINTDMRYVGEESGTLKFGALNLSKGDWNWFYIKRELANLVIEVGARNVDMTWGEEYAFGGYNGTDADFGITDAKFRKVGTGTLNTKASNYPSIEAVGGTVSFEDNDGPSTSFVFGGGTFRFNSASYTDPMSKFDFVNSTGPIDIDTAGHTFTWTTAIGGSFSIVKRGTGTLALTGAHEYTGKTDVKGGVLILPYRDFGSQEVAVASGAELHLDMTGVAVIENIPVSFFTTTDAGAVERVKLLGSADYTFPLSRSEETGLVSYTPTAIDQSAPNTWIGGAEGDWNVAANWSRGVPQATHNVVVESTADIYSAKAGDHAVKSLAVNGESFTLRASNKDNAPNLIVESITGSGKIILCRAGLENASGVAMTVANDIEFGASDNGYESWLASNGALVKYTGSVKALLNCGKFAIYGHNNMELTGDVTVDSNINADSKIEETRLSGNLTINGNFTFSGCTVDDSGSVAINNQCSFKNDQIYGDVTVSALELQSSGCTFAGSFVVTNSGRVWSKNTDDFSGSLEIVHGGTFSTDSRDGNPSTVSGNVTLGGQFNVFNSSTVSGDVAISSSGVLSICKDASVSGDISGKGTVEMKDGGTYTLSGDNGGFEGVVTHTHQGQLWFKNPKSGSAKALWNVSEDIVFDFDYTQISEDDAVIEFGAFQGTKNKRYYQDLSKKLTVKIGALSNVESWIRVAHFGARDWKDGSKLTKLTIVKVGDGKFSTSVFGCPKFVVEEGELTFEVIADGQYSGDTFFSTGCNEIDSVVVKKGSALSGSLHAEMQVASIDFEDGSYYRLTRTSDADEVYTVNSLTATNIKFGKNVYLYLNETDREKASEGTVLSGSVTGSPMTTVLNESKTDIAACKDDGWYWTASKEDPGVKLVSAQVAETSVNALATDEATAETSVTIRDADLAAWLAAGEATDKVNTANGNGVTGILAYMTGAENYTGAKGPVLGATVADGTATLTFDESAFRSVLGLKLRYYLESSDNADFSGDVVKGEAGDDPSVQLDISNAKTYNRLCAEVLSAE